MAKSLVIACPQPRGSKFHRIVQLIDVFYGWSQMDAKICQVRKKWGAGRTCEGAGRELGRLQLQCGEIRRGGRALRKKQYTTTYMTIMIGRDPGYCQ